MPALGSPRLIRSLRGGQITIPAEFRRELGIDDDTMLRVILEDGELRIRPIHVEDRATGSPWLKALYDEFAPVREEIERQGASENEVNAAIDAAIRAVRNRHD